MGFNTVLMVCNDQLHNLRDDPNAGQIIAETIQNAGCFPGPRGQERNINQPFHGRQGVAALMPRHADDAQLVLVGRNTMQLVGLCWTSDPLEAIKQVADQLGYKLIKKPERKTS